MKGKSFVNATAVGQLALKLAKQSTKVDRLLGVQHHLQGGKQRYLVTSLEEHGSKAIPCIAYRHRSNVSKDWVKDE